MKRLATATSVERLLGSSYARFCLVGSGGLLVDSFVLVILAGGEFSSMRLMVSKVIAAEVAILNNFILNTVWTFRAKRPRSYWRALLYFNFSCGSGVFLSAAMLHILVFFFNVPVLAGNLIAIAVVSVWNFLLSRHFAWREGPAQPAR